MSNDFLLLMIIFRNKFTLKLKLQLLENVGHHLFRQISVCVCVWSCTIA